jgi:MFS superfamily sulfate permease-like transporter
VLAVAIAVSAGLGLSGHGVAVVGTIPTGLPGVSWPHLKLDDLWVLLPCAAGMMLVIFSEALGAGQTFADKHGYRLESSQEMVALGLANLGSGVLGGLACGGSLSQSAVNDGAGARTEMSPVIAAALSLVTVIALTPLFTDLPEAVLAALIIPAVSHLMKGGRDAPVPQARAARVLAGHADPARRDRAGRPARAWCSSWTATTTSTSPAPSSSASWPTA